MSSSLEHPRDVPHQQEQVARRLPVGAELSPAGGAHFRVWAPDRQGVEVAFVDGPVVALQSEAGGYFAGYAPSARAGDRYRFRLDGRDSFPDPVSRFQPEGPHGPSQLVDHAAFPWTDAGWRGLALQGQVVYEMHIGTFTKEGTWAAAIEQLPALAETGITVLEVMPVAEFPGKFGWGYDGVQLFAPYHYYGDPDEFRRFIDRAHALGMAVILDVVYNHLGPDGNYLGQYSKAYFSQKHKTDWGEGINFDDKNCLSVREFYITNARYWIEEYHLDGLRLDATQDIKDDSEPNILAEITRAVRSAAQGRETILIGENEPQESCLIRPLTEGGYGLDALWNDDLHHSAMVRLTGRNEAYYTDYLGSAQEFVSAMKYGYLYQGQFYRWQRQRRGTPSLDRAPWQFVTFFQNHDQVANSARGLRAQAVGSPGVYKALTTLLLLGPGTPMLFQGQEFAASSPFLFFADHKPELARLIQKGRREFMEQWRSLKSPTMDTCFAPPQETDTFERSKLDHSERERHRESYALCRDLLHLRKSDPVFRSVGSRDIDGAVLSPDAFVLRFFSKAHGDRLLVVNFGLDLRLFPAPEPLLAPPQRGLQWNVLFSTEDRLYGGCSTPPLETPKGWRIPGQSAVALVAGPERESAKPKRKKERRNG